MGGRVVMYQLTAKLVDSEIDIPPDAQDIMYYTLSVGHHTGVMDCFSAKLSCPIETFESVLENIADDRARSKLGGILRFGEIQIDKSHLPVLKPAIKRTLRELFTRKDTNPYSAELVWMSDFIQLLDATEKETAMYLMGRRIDD
ncbi:formate hydrogenlyase maturation protein HycH [Raoultibacter massiliensis]|uniref:Formate hydrogenlyase maturation protein HycH n=1 Tax=Raoultibacter massiliensis TaxID=1852371 RepID=A0ABV1JHJ5_9ACTN|nr:formate hydrogenlyase maturation protein HycH [Raoultibacter massiliensis]